VLDHVQATVGAEVDVSHGGEAAPKHLGR
jgi:hypothetical protein